MSDDIYALIGRLRSYMRSSKYIITEDIFAAVDTIEALRAERDQMLIDLEEYRRDVAKLTEGRDRLKAALVRLRDCDWVISLPDRMDAVREIARKALEAEE